MKMVALSDAQKSLPDLVTKARREPIGLTDEDGNLVGLLAGFDEDSVDDILVRTPGFQAMIEQSRASLEREGPVSAEDLLAELRAKLAGEQKKGRGKR